MHVPVRIGRADEGAQAVCIGWQHSHVRRECEGGSTGSAHREVEAVHIGRAEEAVQGRQGAEGEWSRQAVRVRREGTNGTGEWPI